MDRYEKLDILIEKLGSDKVAEEIIRFLNKEQGEEAIEHISRMWDIEI